MNPKYTGHLVWRRTKGSEVLIDPTDVAWGYEKRYTWTGSDQWRWSTDRVHEPLISDEAWAAACEEAAQGKARKPVIRQSDVKRTYILRGLVRCALCGRLMEGDSLDAKARYRCRLSGNRAFDPVLAEGHPKHTSTREDRIVPALDRWLASAFDRSQIDDTIAALVPHQTDPLAEHRAKRAREVIADCDERLARYRTLLDTGGVEADVVGLWMTEVRAKRAAAGRELLLASEAEPLTADVLRDLIKAMGSIRRRLRAADPALKQALYRELGVGITFTPGARTFAVTVLPPSIFEAANPQVSTLRGESCVGGGTCT